MKSSVAILDFGTGKITVMIGSRGLNDSVCIDGIGICDYDGFVEGQWIAPELLKDAVERVIATAESSARLKINKLYIGVPGDFLLCKVNDVVMSFGKKRRVLDSDIVALNNQGNEYFSDPDYTVINIQPIYYKLDDERKLVAPVGMVSTRLGGSISYTLCDNKFISLVNDAVSACGIYETEFVSAPLAEFLFLFDDYKRDNGAILADVGAYGTTLGIGRGDGLCAQYYFCWGGERITGALCDSFDISVQAADELKHKLALSLDSEFVPPEPDADAPQGELANSSDSDIVQTEYTVDVNGESRTFNMAQVNAVVCSELRIFAKFVEKALKSCEYRFFDSAPLSLTGGGLKIRGAEEYIQKCLNRDVELVKPHLPLLDKPELSSPLALMDMVLSSEAQYEGVFGKLRRWFEKRRK